MGSKNSPAGMTTTTTSNAPWEPQQPYLETLMSDAMSRFEGNPPAYYPGATYATPPSTVNQALSGLATAGHDFSTTAPLLSQNYSLGEQLAQGSLRKNNPAMSPLAQLSAPGAGLSSTATGALTPFAQGDYLNGGAANPYTQALSQNILSSVVPSIESQFVQGGDLASPQAAFATAQGATNALAPSLFSNYQTQEGLAQQAANTLGSQSLASGALRAQAANNAGGLYNTGVQQQIAGEALVPTLESSYFAGPQAELQSGLQGQQLQQQSINDAVQRWNYNQTIPYQALNQALAEISGNYGGTSAMSTPFYQNTGANIGSGALGGAMLGNSLFGTGGMLANSGISAGTGKGLGALLGAGMAFSDRRLKKNIKRVGTLDNGLPVYLYRFHEELPWQIGLMADEVETVHPDAVLTGPRGYKMVDYSRAVA